MSIHFCNAFMCRMLNFYQFKNPKSSQIFHTGPRSGPPTSSPPCVSICLTVPQSVPSAGSCFSRFQHSSDSDSAAKLAPRLLVCLRPTPLHPYPLTPPLVWECVLESRRGDWVYYAWIRLLPSVYGEPDSALRHAIVWKRP